MSLTTYDVVILGGGLAGLCLARQLRQEEAPHRGAGGREAAASGARGRLQGRRVERRDRRALLPEAPRPRAAPGRRASSRSSGFRYFFTARATTATCVSRIELGPPRFPPVPSLPARPRPSRELPARENRARTAPTCRDGCRVDGGRARRPRSHRVDARTPAARPARVRGALGRRCERPQRPAQAASSGCARPAAHGANAGWFRVRRASAWTTGPTTRPGRRACPTGQRWLSTTHLMGPGYWVVADSARLGRHQRRHRRRRRHAPVQTHQPLRARDGLAARVRAAVRRGRRRASRTSSRTSSRCSTSRTAARRSSRPIAGR